MKTILWILALTLLGVCLTAQSDTRQESDPFTKLQKIAVSQLEAKALASPVAVVEVANIPVQAAVVVQSKPVASGGNKDSWLAASGIPQSDWQYVDYIISHESGWNPNAQNPSGAGGLPQALPYSKTGCGWGDAVCQLRWADSYAKASYGSWAGAYSAWQSKNWW